MRIQEALSSHVSLQVLYYQGLHVIANPHHIPQFMIIPCLPGFVSDASNRPHNDAFVAMRGLCITSGASTPDRA